MAGVSWKKIKDVTVDTEKTMRPKPGPSAKEKDKSTVASYPKWRRKPLSYTREPTFFSMQKHVTAQVDRIKVKFDDIDTETISNILTYSKQLPKIPTDEFVDGQVFNAELFKHFKIGDESLLERMYRVTASFGKTEKVDTAKFTELICIFITSDMKKKVDFVFSVYDDTTRDGCIRTDDILLMMRPVADAMSQDYQDEEEQANDKGFLLNMVMQIANIEPTGGISRLRFHTMVKHNPLMIQFLGGCLPNGPDIERFKKKVVNRTTIEVAGMFRHERRDVLNDPLEQDRSVISTLYSVRLELP